MNHQILGVLKSLDVLAQDTHVVFANGNHSSTYVDKDKIYLHIGPTSALCSFIARSFRYSGAQAVIAPVVAGVILSQWIAYHLTELTNREILALYADRVEDRFVVRRGYETFIPGKKILVADDILTTGETARKMVEAVRNLDGNVVGFGAIINRGRVTSEDIGDVEITALVDLPLESWREEECPLCQKRVAINTGIGKGKEFLKRKQS